jgi:oligopeptidase B
MRLIFLAVLWTLTGAACMHKSPTDHPRPPKKPHKMEKHGDVRTDDYFWMKERESKEVVDHLNAENRYWESVLKPVEGLRETLFKEMKSRIKEEDTSAPARKDEYFYYTRTETGKQYPIYARRKGSMAAPEEILADINQIATGHEFTQCSGPQMSPDHNLMAMACDFVGRRFYKIIVKDLRTGKDTGVEIKDVSSNLVWAADNQHFFYVKQHPETLRSMWVYRFDMKTKKSDLVFEEKDETFSVGVGRSLARQHIFIGSYATLTTEIRYLRADRPLDDFKVFFPREREHRYDVMDGGDRFYVLTNWKAKNNRLMETPVDKTDRKNWKNVIAHRKDVFLEDVTAFKSHLVAKEREAGQDRLMIHTIGKRVRAFEVPMKDQSFVVDLSGNMEYDPSFVRYEYESMRRPETTFDFNFKEKTSKVIKVREVPGFDPDKYRTERVWIVARDGQRVPVSLVMKKDLELNGKNPMLVYGYGSYGASMSPWFSGNRISLVDRGWVYAMTHVRGGRELGEDWYNSGRTMKKMNTFTDFIDTTEALIKLGYADPKRVYAQGGSAGGLLMGAVMNLRPDLYRAMVAQVPFVDIMTTMLDDTIPLTTGEYDEWGNPNEKPAYDYMRSYSPYDNLKPVAYPHLLATTGLHDSQVQYWEPAKWVAKIRDLKTNESYILLKTDMSAGHGGASGRFEALKEIAVEFAFLLMMDGTTK